MEDFQCNDINQDAEIMSLSSTISRVFDREIDVNFEEDLKDSSMDSMEDQTSLLETMLCDPNSRMIPTGFSRSDCSDEMVVFVNAGGDGPEVMNPSIKLLGDTYYEGGNILRTDENISDAGDFPLIYQSARLGNFCYRFNNLPPGEYYVDLHFAEIVNTNGPKNMRVFNVYLQEEKVLADFDIFSIVGANKPLQLVDLRVTVKGDGMIVIRFEGLTGSPMVCGICVRTAPKASVTEVPREYLKCNNCTAEIELSSAKKKLVRTKATDKYEKKIQELTLQCERKTNECHEAWMSLTAASEQLEQVRMELDNKMFQTQTLDLTMEKQAENIRDITSRYERDKKQWAGAINDLQEKIKAMKNEHAQLAISAHECVDSIPGLSKMILGVQALVAQCEDLKLKYSEEQAKRKELYNQVLETKGSIRVFCRCRPLNKKEVAAGCATVIDFESAKDGGLGISTGSSTKKIFKFDRVYSPKDNQVDVYADASPLVISVLDGYNVCIFAYGQTGTGKTFTMEGIEQNRGVNYRTLEELFKISKERSEIFTYDISVSVLEVYNEQIRDLLATSPSSKKLEIKQSSEGSLHVPGIVEAKVDSIREVWNVLQAGSNARAVGSNNVNEHSSRSHCMLCIKVRAKNLMNGECTYSKLWLVDLAGSERLAKTDVQGERLKEAQNINRSLSALGDVINALATKSSHIPYRNSKLTHLLQDSLAGESKTLMFVQISPSEQDIGETLSSLNFATRVRGVELGPVRKQVDTSELQKMKTMLDKARHESKSKDETLRKVEENLQNVESKVKARDQICKTQQEKIKELEVQLELQSALHNQSEKQISQLSDRLKGREDTSTSLQQKVKELEGHLRERQQSDFATHQQKVKELENKLKEREQEFECNSLTLHHKIKELEMKLNEQEQNPESRLLHEKIRELEDKLRKQEEQMQMQSTTARDFSTIIRPTPTEEKPPTLVKDDDIMSDIEPHILRSSNSVNRRPMAHAAALPKKKESLYETRKKRESRSGGDIENKFEIPISMNDRKIRKSDPPKVVVPRAPRPTRPVSSGQGGPATTTTHKRVLRDQAPPGVKERETRRKMWS